MNKITNKFAFSSLKTCIFQIFVVILQRKIERKEQTMQATKTKETWTISFDPMSTYAQALFQAICLSKQFKVEKSPYDGSYVATVSEAEKGQLITPAMRRRINSARKEYAEGKTISCRTPQEMQQFFDSL